MKAKVAKVIIFCICLALALTGISRILMYKYPESIGAWKEYYAEKADLDVMLFGSSHVLRQINPAIIYHEKGIAGYDIATGGEAIWTTYYSMEEALKYQHPKVALVDVYMLNKGDLYDDTHNVTATFGMKRSLTWFKSILASVPEHKIYYVTRYPLYHTRYKSLTADDFKTDDELFRDIIKGFLVDENHWITHKMADISGMNYTDKVSDKPFPPRVEKYLNKIVGLAKEKGIKLVFIQTPYYCSEETAAQFNVLTKYVDNENVFYWDCNRDIDVMQLDSDVDFRDDNHLNWIGSQKLSRYLADRLSSEFSFEDHRGDQSYSSFEADYQHYCDLLEEFGNNDQKKN